MIIIKHSDCKHNHLPIHLPENQYGYQQEDWQNCYGQQDDQRSCQVHQEDQANSQVETGSKEAITEGKQGCQDAIQQNRRVETISNTPNKGTHCNKNDPNKRGNPIKFTSDPPSAATHMKDASKKRNLNEKGELLNPKKKTDKGAGVE